MTYDTRNWRTTRRYTGASCMFIPFERANRCRTTRQPPEAKRVPSDFSSGRGPRVDSTELGHAGRAAVLRAVGAHDPRAPAVEVTATPIGSCEHGS